jgi:hypothetical protein
MDRQRLLGVASACAIGVTLLASPAGATIVTLEPAGPVTNQTDVANYFNGGNDGYPRDGVGPSDEVIFPGSGITTVFDNATSGKFQNVPSGAQDILFQSVASTMNFASGYGITSLSFDYSDIANSTYSPTVTVWSGANGTGTALATINLMGNSPIYGSAGSACTATGKEFCTWSFSTANFSGLAESVTFGGTGIGQVEFDSVQMNITAVPIPAALPLLLSGFAGLGTWVRRRRPG